jgi:predicted nucleic acid-binding protein
VRKGNSHAHGETSTQHPSASAALRKGLTSRPTRSTEKSPEPIVLKRHNIWIAATAVAHGLPVYTQDEDFLAIPRVFVVRI